MKNDLDLLAHWCSHQGYPHTVGMLYWPYPPHRNTRKIQQNRMLTLALSLGYSHWAEKLGREGDIVR